MNFSSETSIIIKSNYNKKLQFLDVIYLKKTLLLTFQVNKCFIPEQYELYNVNVAALRPRLFTR